MKTEKPSETTKLRSKGKYTEGQLRYIRMLQFFGIGGY